MNTILTAGMTLSKLPCLHGELSGIAQHRADKPKVLALHGWLDNAASFIPLMQQMPDYDWFALDFSGHGHSRHVEAGMSYHFPDYVMDVKYAVDALGWQDFHLVGHSLGANVASIYAAACNEQVRSLSLIDGFGVFAADANDALKHVRQAIQTRLRFAHDVPRVYSSIESLIERRQMAGDISGQSARLLIEYAAICHGEGVQLLSDQRLKQSSFFYLTSAQVEAIFKGIQARTLFIRAKQGLLPALDSMQRLIDAVAKLDIHEIDGQHHLHMDEANDVAHVLDTFLKKAL